jgi:hypothetical protein
LFLFESDALLADLQTTLHNNSANLTGAAETTAASNYGLHVTSHSYQYQDGDDIQVNILLPLY